MDCLCDVMLWPYVAGTGVGKCSRVSHICAPSLTMRNMLHLIVFLLCTEPFVGVCMAPSYPPTTALGSGEQILKTFGVITGCAAFDRREPA